MTINFLFELKERTVRTSNVSLGLGCINKGLLTGKASLTINFLFELNKRAVLTYEVKLIKGSLTGKGFC